MPRFRLLTAAELQELEPEFKQFLIVNELYDKEWRQLAAQDPQKAQSFIELFSDIVLEKSYLKAKGLVQIGQDFAALFLLKEEKWQLVQFQFKSGQLPADLETEQLFDFLKMNWTSAQITRGSKSCPENKTESVHQLVRNGAQILSPGLNQQLQELFDVISA
jgi:hypothetical protein